MTHHAALRIALAASLFAFLAPSAQAQFGGLKNLVNKVKGSEEAPKAEAPKTEAPKARASEPSAARGRSDTPVSTASAVPDPFPVPTEAFVVPTSVRLSVNQQGCFRPTPSSDCKGTGWLPVIKFNLVGPYKSSTKLRVHWTAAGKPWFKSNLEAREDLEPNQVTEVETRDAPEESIRQHTGLISFKITADNALEGSSKVLYEGSFNVGKHHTGNNDPSYKNQFEYYVNHDWALRVAYLGFDQFQDTSDISAFFWLKDAFGAKDEYSCHIFYNGKEISKDEGAILWNCSTTSDFKKTRHAWTLARFRFGNVLGYYRPNGPATRTGIFELLKNPGEYTLKVLRDGELAREAKFTILPNGKLDDAMTKSNNMRGSWTIIPSKVLGDSDGKWDAEAWKTGLFWGNGLKGYAPLP